MRDEQGKSASPDGGYTSEGFVEALRHIVGLKNVLMPTDDDRYSHDTTFLEHDGYVCAVRPGTTAEVADVVRLCAAARTAVVARGSGTSVVGGPVPVAGGVVLSLERLTSLNVDTANAVASAGAGVITAALDREANSHGLMYPPDPGSVELCTIGGNVACNSGGMRCLKYGTTADYVIGLTVVLADGRVLRLGGKLRKRASGYRLMQLFVGSEGTLGIVTEVIVKLLPLPRHRVTAMIAYESIEDAGAAVSRVLAEGLLPAALEILDAASLLMLGDRLPANFPRASGAALIVEQDGTDEEAVELDLMRTVGVLAGVENWIARSRTDRERLWRARRDFGVILMALPGSFVCEDVAVPISQIPEMIRRIERLSDGTGLRIATVGHAGDGNLHPTFLFEEKQRHLVSSAAAQLFRDALELGGSVSAEHGLGALKRDFAEAEHGKAAVDVWRSLKRLLDPEGVLNPHKVLPENPPDDEFLARLAGWTVPPDQRQRAPEVVL
jgi:glycolate oxidase